MARPKREASNSPLDALLEWTCYLKYLKSIGRSEGPLRLVPGWGTALQRAQDVFTSHVRKIAKLPSDGLRRKLRPVSGYSSVMLLPRSMSRRHCYRRRRSTARSNRIFASTGDWRSTRSVGSAERPVAFDQSHDGYCTGVSNSFWSCGSGNSSPSVVS